MAENPKLTFAHDGITKSTQNGKFVAPTPKVGTLDYSTTECATTESEYIAQLMAEALNVAAGPVNVFSLLGVHNQGATIDQAGQGFPLSSGTPSGFNVADAFNVNDDSWRSIQQGADVTSTPAYLGYNFGTKKAWDGVQERYFPGEPVRKKISTIKIRQGLDQRNRATQVRVEASDDGLVWHRVDVVNLPDSDQLETVGVNKAIAEYGQWRLVPTFFNGVAANFQWEVVELHLLVSNQVSLDTIEDYILLENRDRSYSQASALLKCTYDLLDVQTELAKFGINLPQTYIFTTSFITMVTTLGRPVLVGDVIELPGEIQYDHDLKPVRKWLEVTDTGWSTEGYTHDWRPQLFRFYAQPILPSVEHRDILGTPGQAPKNQTDEEFVNQTSIFDSLGDNSAEAIQQAASEAAPQTGSDETDYRSGKPDTKPAGLYDGNDIYAEDALPPDSAAYTFGDSLPDPTTIQDLHWHRQTYTNVHQSIRPPDRLLQWRADLGRWKVVEVNKRGKPSSHKKTISNLLMSETAKAPDSKL